jgi:protein-tyrosine phosphatase
MGNICRSPMAEGVLMQMLEKEGLTGRVWVDSAGTHSYHQGSPPDYRGQETAARRGIRLENIRARPLQREDLDTFDYILAMDQANYQHILSLCEIPAQRQRVELFMKYASGLDETEVPDPYYGNALGFERVMDMIEEAAEGLLLHIRSQHNL